jgi:acyl-CoA thioesterase-1
MSRFMQRLALAVVCFIVPVVAQAADKLRISCVGDSITFGACVSDPAHNGYPAVLGNLLGEGYEVKNFGVSGTTLLKHGDSPYWNTGEFKAAGEFKPSIVIIMLGSNDTKPQNWSKKGEFAGDYKAMVEHYRGLESHPKVYVVLPVPALKTNFGISEPAVLEQQPLIKQVAAEEKCPIVDMHAQVNKPEQFDNDGIHPNNAGAKAMAEVFAKALKADAAK